MLKTDCSYFKGDKPCDVHKEKSVKCEDCDIYNPIKFKILIIKLDAVGDVLRTTSILKPLKIKYPDSYVEWCTRQNAVGIFKNNPLVDEVITIEDDAHFRINAEEYELVINLDTSKLSSAIAACAIAKEKRGFVLNKKGFVEATSVAAEHWLEMSAFDDVKKENTKTHQQIMYEIMGFDLQVERPIIHISENEKSKIAVKDFVKNIDPSKTVVGLNVGIGTKWPSKGWPLKKWKELIEKLNPNKYNLLLLGGPEETATIAQLKEEYNFLVDTGCDNSLPVFAAIVDMCDLVVTADTLALHIATALNKKVVALFGPTSVSEIELYGKGIKLSSSDRCKCFYRKYCLEEFSCMEKITSNMVVDSINTLIK